MEEQAVVENLRASRERLRSWLVPGSGASGVAGDDAFPRSALMRFLLEPRRRRAALAVLSTLWMVARRVRR